MNRRDGIERLGGVFFFLRDAYVVDTLAEAFALNSALLTVHKLRRDLWREVYATELPTFAEHQAAFATETEAVERERQAKAWGIIALTVCLLTGGLHQVQPVTRHPVALGGFRVSPSIGQEEALRNVLRKLVNLAGHPYFPEVKDLPAWAEAIQEARNIL